jgi:hypothetical protein
MKAPASRGESLIYLTCSTPRSRRRVLVWLLAALLTLIIHTPGRLKAECNWAPQPLPAGVAQQYVLNIDHQFTPPVDYELPSGADFDANVMGRDSVQSLARRQQAVDFFLSEYGIDFSAGDTDPSGSVALIYTMVDSAWLPKVVHSGGDMVLEAGWQLHEARYVMTVLSPTMLHGTFGGIDGVMAPFGTTAVFGEWVMETRTPCRNPDSEQTGQRYFQFQSRYPFLPDFFGGAGVDYVVRDSVNNLGRAQGSLTLRYLSNGDLHAIAKMVVRFPE